MPPLKWTREEWEGWGDGIRRPGWACTLSSPVRVFQIEDGRLYAITDESVVEIDFPPEDHDNADESV